MYFFILMFLQLSLMEQFTVRNTFMDEMKKAFRHFDKVFDNFINILFSIFEFTICVQLFESGSNLYRYTFTYSTSPQNLDQKLAIKMVLRHMLLCYWNNTLSNSFSTFGANFLIFSYTLSTFRTLSQLSADFLIFYQHIAHFLNRQANSKIKHLKFKFWTQ